MRNSLLSLFFLILCFSCTTNNDQISIDKEVELLHAQAAKTSLDSSRTYLHSAKRLIEKNPEVPDSLKAVNHSLLGHYFRRLQQTDSAIYYFERAKASIKDSVRTFEEANFFYFTFEAYESQNKHGDALAVTDAFKSKIDLSTSSGFKTLLFFMYQDVYLKMKNYEEALKYNKLELDEAIKQKSTAYIPNIIIKKAKILYDINSKKEAYRLLDSLVKKQEQYSLDVNLQVHNVIGLYKYNDKDYADAIIYYKKALLFAKSKSDAARRTQDLAVVYSNIAEAYLESKLFKDAAVYLDSTKHLGIENLNSTVQKNYLNYKLRYAIATNNGAEAVVTDLENLYEYQRKDYEDKFNEELVALTEANMAERILQEEKAQAEQKNSNLRNTLLWSGVGGLLLILGGVLYYRYTRVALEREHMKTHQRLLRAQMNPHFTFNTLSVISRMIDNSPVDAKKYLVKFSRLLGAIFENSTFDYVLLEKELDALKAYMDLQKLRLQEPFEYTIDFKNIAPDLVYVPGMLLQPIVENSLNHGFHGIDHKGEIRICLEQKGTFIQCSIEDNGSGLSSNYDEKERTSSTKLIRAFLEKVTKTEMSFRNKKDLSKEKSGVIVTFSIPFKTTLNA